MLTLGLRSTPTLCASYSFQRGDYFSTFGLECAGRPLKFKLYLQVRNQFANSVRPQGFPWLISSAYTDLSLTTDEFGSNFKRRLENGVHVLANPTKSCVMYPLRQVVQRSPCLFNRISGSLPEPKLFVTRLQGPKVTVRIQRQFQKQTRDCC